MVSILRFALMVFLALLLWGNVSSLSSEFGISKIIVAVLILIIGVTLQLIYARAFNANIDATGMPSNVRNRLRNDIGVAPFRVQVVGFFARVFLLAGSVIPILEATGLMETVTVSG